MALFLPTFSTAYATSECDDHYNLPSRPILYCLRYMCRLDGLATRQIRDRARQLEHTVEGGKEREVPTPLAAMELERQ